MKQVTLTEQIILEPGYRQVYPGSRPDSNGVSRLKKGEKVQPQAHVSKRAGVTMGELITLLAVSGVGRPSTYATTVDALLAHGYCVEAEGSLLVTPLGADVLALVGEKFPYLLDLGLTATLERALDGLAAGETSYTDTITPVWQKLSKKGQE
jgi:DNA topoisomerase-1